MQKTILITGSTDGIGFETAKALALENHHILLHGRNAKKLEKAVEEISKQTHTGTIEHYLADLSQMADVENLAEAITDNHSKLDVLINNAGVLKTSSTQTADGLDTRFAVNTIAPYLLTKRLMPLLGDSARVINLSSAAQDTVDLNALTGKTRLSDMPAYAQSKLAITMWSYSMAMSQKEGGPLYVSVNPGSLLATKMVKEGFNMDGKDITIGSDILVRAALSDEFSASSGQYFDNDSGSFAQPHPDATNAQKSAKLVDVIESTLADLNYPV